MGTIQKNNQPYEARFARLSKPRTEIQTFEYNRLSEIEVATQERHAVLKKLEKNFPQTESHNSIDEHLVKPWNEACKIFKTDKQSAESLREISKTIESFYRKWVNSVTTQTEYSPAAKEATETIKTIRPPAGTHPIFITWRNSESEWQKFLASCTYKKYHRSSFTMHAFGETLCQMKASTFPSRIITNEILACYKVNKKTIQQLMAKELTEEDVNTREEFEGEDAIEAMLNGGLVPGAYYDDDADDAMSVE
ncbi:RNA polymerase [Aspergillus sclerotialis]|uniref:RNA polymerase n=1 Tax=Aspergillus sclerotialis TaxID=2070753 RepID=A0A3A2ZQR2_9EURO|nr:RNA polymerase [Aspergillus sclerotialis]